MPYGHKIRKLLEERGMTQAELSRLSGIKESNISYIVNNDRSVRENTLRRICAALNCKAEDIWKEVE